MQPTTREPDSWRLNPPAIGRRPRPKHRPLLSRCPCRAGSDPGAPTTGRPPASDAQHRTPARPTRHLWPGPPSAPEPKAPHTARRRGPKTASLLAGLRATSTHHTLPEKPPNPRGAPRPNAHRPVARGCPAKGPPGKDSNHRTSHPNLPQAREKQLPGRRPPIGPPEPACRSRRRWLLVGSIQPADQARPNRPAPPRAAPANGPTGPQSDDRPTRKPGR